MLDHRRPQGFSTGHFAVIAAVCRRHQFAYKIIYSAGLSFKADISAHTVIDKTVLGSRSDNVCVTVGRRRKHLFKIDEIHRSGGSAGGGQQCQPFNGEIVLRGYRLTVELGLAVFNLIPIHPLDGSRILAFFLPYRAIRWIEEHEQFIYIGFLVVILFTNILDKPLNWVSQLMFNWMNWLTSLVLGV